MRRNVNMNKYSLFDLLGRRRHLITLKCIKNNILSSLETEQNLWPVSELPALINRHDDSQYYQLSVGELSTEITCLLNFLWSVISEFYLSHLSFVYHQDTKGYY